MIKLVYGDQTLLVAPWIPSLEPLLTCTRREQKHEFGKVTNVFHKEPLFFVNTDDKGNSCGVVYIGLHKRVETFLETGRYPYEKSDIRSVLPEPDYSQLTGTLRPFQAEALAAIDSSHGGLIVAPPAFGKSFLIMQIRRIYPKLKILVSTMQKSVLQQLYDDIVAGNPTHKIGLIHAGKPYKYGWDTVVCSAQSLHRVDPNWADLFLFDEVHNTPAVEVSNVINSLKCRKFGFTATPTGRSDGTDILMESLFGPVLFYVPYQQAQLNNLVVPIDVHMVPVKCAEIPKKFKIASDRHNIWRNRTRNEIIARMAHRYTATHKVLIMVKTVEHALFLNKFLPDFALMYSSIQEHRMEHFKNMGLVPDGFPATVDSAALKEKFKAGEITKVISTMAWKEGVDLPDLPVLIRADGQPGAIPSIQIGGRLSRTSENKEKGILIDFLDDFGGKYLNSSKLRVRHYKKMGWTILEDKVT